MSHDSLLKLSGLSASYDQFQVLHELDLSLQRGQIVSVLGRNGAGRSSLLKAIMGLLPSQGEIHFAGVAIQQWPVWKIARRGIAYVPETRDVFAHLSCMQNLKLGMQPARHPGHNWQLDDVFELFPRLRERAKVDAGHLSGGEQQMLSIARSLLGNPLLMLIDEPTEGLAPQIVEQLSACFLKLKAHGLALMLVEQKLDMALQISDAIHLLGQGRLQFSGSLHEFSQAHDLRQQWLEV